MKSVTFSCSAKILTEVLVWADFLREHGVTVRTPDTTVDNRVWQTGTPEQIRDLARKLTLQHFKKIEETDVVFVFNPGGRIGNSVTLEIGCAVGVKKPIYALTSDVGEVCRDVLFSGYCETKEQLLELLCTPK